MSGANEKEHIRLNGSTSCRRLEDLQQEYRLLIQDILAENAIKEVQWKVALREMMGIGKRRRTGRRT